MLFTGGRRVKHGGVSLPGRRWGKTVVGVPKPVDREYQ
jgi:hypothetical protein